MRADLLKLSRFELAVFAAAVACGAAPLWAGGLPLVDLPQHLHLVSVLHRLDDASTLFPDWFARRPVLTPYLGVYYAVSLLNWLFPLELANRLFLSLYAVGFPLSLAYLLHSLRRPVWPALLSVPFVYGDSFGWGFLNYCAAIPLGFLTCAFFVQAIERVQHARKRAAVALALTLASVLLFHVQIFLFLAVALPVLLALTAAPEDATRREPWPMHFWRTRKAALLGVLPGVGLFSGWVALRLGKPAEIAYGQPWKAWGPTFSPENLAWKGFEQNKAELFSTLANLLADGSDRFAVNAALVLAVGGAAAALVLGRERTEGPVARWRIVALALVALLLFFCLPFDIRGYVYALNTRFSHLAAALAVACVPPLVARWRRAALVVAALVGPLTAWPLTKAFHHFGEEQAAVASLAELAPLKPKVMGLVYDPRAQGFTLPLHLHDAAVIARLRGGLTNFSFALTPHSPLMYRGEPPPTFASEWRPDTMDWNAQGRAYDTFLIRGAHPRQVLGEHLGKELEIAGEAKGFWLVRRVR